MKIPTLPLTTLAALSTITFTSCKAGRGVGRSTKDLGQTNKAWWKRNTN